ncbi:hypothetical protein [Streptomyces griseus]|uniref:hypothetical protein n=1 Tax=Streptomyces griseus TaxID=1911 RepID=UPI0009A116EA|nr:hypothetical protein [Streptomyces griseus]
MTPQETGGTTTTATGIEAGTEAGEPAEEQPVAGEPPPRGRSNLLRVLATVSALVLLATGGFLLSEGQRLRDTPATANRALTDTEATTRVIGDVSSALAKVFSYSPHDTAATEEAAKRLLAGEALRQYAALFGQVERQSADQKLTLTSQAVRAGVTRLSGDSAHLLVFLDQVYEREGRAATTAAAQLSVTARLRGGHWQIVEITSR